MDINFTNPTGPHDIKTIRMEVHKKGLCLSETWSELFNLLTKYQGELHTKENELIAKELTRDVSDMVTNSDRGSNDVQESVKLNSALQQKQSALVRVQSELDAKTKLVKQFQNDLSYKERQVIQLQEDVRQSKECNQRLKTSLDLLNSAVYVKDQLIDKIQSQMIREVGDMNSELKTLQESLYREKRQHGRERQQWEAEVKQLLRQVSRN